MTKKIVNYNRQMVTKNKTYTQYEFCYTMDELESIVKDFSKQNIVDPETVVMRFSIDSAWDEYAVEMELVGMRPETDAEMKVRIEKEEAAVARDKENARKSREQQKKQDAKSAKKLLEKYGVDGIKKLAEFE